jgi:hypothetical protein
LSSAVLAVHNEWVLVGRILEATSDTLGAKRKKIDAVVEVMPWGMGPWEVPEHPKIDPPFPRS